MTPLIKKRPLTVYDGGLKYYFKLNQNKIPLTHLRQLLLYYTPLVFQFSGSIKREHWFEISVLSFVNLPLLNFQHL